ncbi:hypothetical protein [Mucilaginibacter lacusdianchii]|uniref:hypothetical protein n=1 Tax=Mucilaginibacter lacusdianchii TaxID=2684211 RepID=UPI00131C71D1|nr:hypothetical protein [Mucilaginibacter sp. JXJ CY 39]
MNEPFILEVDHENQVLALQSAFQRYGFTYRITVQVGEVTYLFEKDEKGEYRAFTESGERERPDKALLKAIAAKLKML